MMTVTALALKLRGLFHLGGESTWRLYDIGKYVQKKGGYSPELLNGRMRHEEVNGPPRIGDVSLNSKKIRKTMAKNHEVI